jgi:chromosome partitioning protein
MRKALVHRLLVNKMPFGILPTHQAMTLDEIDNSDMVRFKNVLHLRPILSETWKTGTPPHYADQRRVPVQKAVEEIDLITDELLAVFQPQEERAAA